MGLVVDEIVDIVEDKLDIQVGSDRAGVLGSAVVRGPGHRNPRRRTFPAARLCRLVPPQGPARRRSATRTLLLVDDSAFFRNMLSPVLKAAGYEVTAVPGAQEALALLKNGRSASTCWSPTSTCPTWMALRSPRRCAASRRFGDMPIIALSSYSSPESIERGRQVGFHDYVAKFDRQSLIAALKEQTADIVRAA